MRKMINVGHIVCFTNYGDYIVVSFLEREIATQVTESEMIDLVRQARIRGFLFQKVVERAGIEYYINFDNILYVKECDLYYEVVDFYKEIIEVDKNISLPMSRLHRIVDVDGIVWWINFRHVPLRTKNKQGVWDIYIGEIVVSTEQDLVVYDR